MSAPQIIPTGDHGVAVVGPYSFADRRWERVAKDQPLRNCDLLILGIFKGKVFASKRRQRDEPVQRVGRGKRKCYMTDVAVIRDRPELIR